MNLEIAARTLTLFLRAAMMSRNVVLLSGVRAADDPRYAGFVMEMGLTDGAK
jgi:hypothetical protein